MKLFCRTHHQCLDPGKQAVLLCVHLFCTFFTGKRPFLYKVETRFTLHRCWVVVVESQRMRIGCRSPFEIKQETSFSRVIALHRFGTSSHVGSGARNLDSQMDAFAARLAALEQGVRDRDAPIQHQNSIFAQQQGIQQAHSSGSSCRSRTGNYPREPGQSRKPPACPKRR